MDECMTVELLDCLMLKNVNTDYSREYVDWLNDS